MWLVDYGMYDMLEGTPKFRADFPDVKLVGLRMCLHSQWNQKAKRFWGVAVCLPFVSDGNGATIGEG